MSGRPRVVIRNQSAAAAAADLAAAAPEGVCDDAKCAEECARAHTDAFVAFSRRQREREQQKAAEKPKEVVDLSDYAALRKDVQDLKAAVAALVSPPVSGAVAVEAPADPPALVKKPTRK